MEEIVSTLSQLISNVGFPIACVAVMFSMLEKERADHKEESRQFVEAINNNTSVMQRLVDRLEAKQ